MEKRADNLTEFIHNETKTFRQDFHRKHLPATLLYFHNMYGQLAECYQQHITPQVQQTLDSSAMLDYFSCYKRTLRQAKQNNQRLYQQGLRIEVRLKQCIQVKSAITKSSVDFHNDRQQCLDQFTKGYQELYASILPTIEQKGQKAKPSAGGK